MAWLINYKQQLSIPEISEHTNQISPAVSASDLLLLHEI